MREYLRLTFTCNGFKAVQTLKLTEQNLISTLLRDGSDKQNAKIELVECTQEEWDALFEYTKKLGL